MFKQLTQYFVRSRSNIVLGRVKPYLKNTDKILDIGSGTGDVALVLQQNGFDIVPVDVSDFHGVRVIPTKIYDGKRLPFKDKSFDKALLLMVLHHTSDPMGVLKEASRVAGELIVIETSYTNLFSKCMTVILDTLANFRLRGYWNSYKSDKEWREIFGTLNYCVVDSNRYFDKTIGFPFLHISYFLQKAG